MYVVLSRITIRPIPEMKAFCPVLRKEPGNYFQNLKHSFARSRKKAAVLDVDTEHVSSLTSYQPAYLDKELELIVGYQTEKPLTRGVNPFGGIRMARSACEAYGYKLSEKVEQEFTYRTTHNDGVYRVYSDEMRKARKCGVITGLPDAYGRGQHHRGLSQGWHFMA